MDLEQAQTAMKIILHAGDARVKTKQAVQALKDFDTEEAKRLLAEAQEDITKAHQVQTTALQAESRGEDTEYSILFTHAQDTCMTVYSEMNLAEDLIALCESIDHRFKALEK